MRFLLESKDAGNDAKAWESVVVHTEGLALGMHDIRLAYLRDFSEAESDILLAFFNKVYSQVEAGLWGVGDSCIKIINGCTFHISAIEVSKH